MKFNRLKSLRTSKGYSNREMAKKIGVTASTYFKKENGQIPLSLEDARKISEVFGCSIDDMFFYSDENGTDDNGEDNND